MWCRCVVDDESAVAWDGEGVCVRLRVVYCLECALCVCGYGVATISRLLKIIGLFCRISSVLKVSFAKETYNLEEPTSRSHPVGHALRVSSALS